ncbi:MAG: hypothetical protein ACJAWH_001672 [Maribacter sp.]|jgi:hypothetical protein
MCPNFKILNSTPNGVIYWFESCEMARVIFNNLCFDFYPEEYNAFLNYISGLDGDQIEKQYENSVHKRKIPIPMGNSCMTIILNKEELLELKFLFNNKEEYYVLKNPKEEINYQMNLN